MLHDSNYHILIKTIISSSNKFFFFAYIFVCVSTARLGTSYDVITSSVAEGVAIFTVPRALIAESD